MRIARERNGATGVTEMFYEKQNPRRGRTTRVAISGRGSCAEVNWAAGEPPRHGREEPRGNRPDSRG